MSPNDPLAPRPRATAAPRSRSRAQRGRLHQRLVAAGALAAATLAASACGEDGRAPVAGTDAGVLACERGTEGCACIGGSGCRDDLLCIAGRCLRLEEEPPGEDPARPSRPPPGSRPTPEVPDASAPGTAPADGGPGPLDAGGAADAAAADAGGAG